MARYSVTFKKSVTKDLRVIPKDDIKKILDRIAALSDNPKGDGCIKLSGNECYRVRQGLYRIIYEIKDDVLVVNVIKVAHRSQVYKNN
ncbi:MAG: type II toxin-antitoxin system RelE/ParE family toxin [Cycloclasticus sp.]